MITDFWIPDPEDGKTLFLTFKLDSGIQISQEEKQMVKDILINWMNQNSYRIKNLIVWIISKIIEFDFPDVWDGFMEKICEGLLDDDVSQIDLSLRILINAIKPDERFHVMINKILENLFSAFTNSDVDSKIREKWLQLYFQWLRWVSWADGIDEKVLTTALDDTFNTWMTLFLQLIQSNPKVHFDIKKNALKWLTVIFRDMINYSIESISIVLQPAWKLLNVNLAVYTEAIGYGRPIEYSDTEKQTFLPEELSIWMKHGIESEPEDEEVGIIGMTMHLIELLTSLATKGSIRNLIFIGIVPLITSVASYMILSNEQENESMDDQSQFININNEVVYEHSVRNYCLNFISQIIENFDDDAVEAILWVAENFLLSMSESKAPSVETNFDEVDVMKYTYNSTDNRHGLKKREVALFLLGSISDDIVKYRERKGATNFSLINIFGSIILPDLNNKDIPNILKGRAMWWATKLSGLMIDKDPHCIDVVNSSVAMLSKDNKLSLRIWAWMTLVHFINKVDVEQIENISEYISSILESVDELFLQWNSDTIHIPVSAMKKLSKMDELAVSKVAHESAPRLLQLFKRYHDNSSIVSDLLDIFKMWTNYEKWKSIFCNNYTPFALEIVKNYFHITNTKDTAILGNEIRIQNKKEELKALENADTHLDSSILQHSLDILWRLLKKTDPESQEHSAVIDIFPVLLQIALESQDIYLLLHTTSCLRTFIAISHEKIKERKVTKRILEVAKKMLKPETNEAAAVFLGNFIIQIFSKISPKIDTDILMGIVEKIRKCRIPTIVQSLVLVYARLFHTNPDKIIEFLNETSVNDKISLKVLLDKWLLHQPLFRGNYAKNTTFSALLKILSLNNPHISALNVVGYNPSHKNVKSEVNAPFKILSILLRMIKNEEKMEKQRKKIEENKGKGETKGYKFQYDENGRMDTMGGDDDYNEDIDNSYEDENEEIKESIEVNMDEIQDEEDEQVDLLADLIKESKDKGLADLETGSEVYMSEMLGFEIEDAEEMEEQNEEDLLSLADTWSDINLKEYVQNGLIDLFKTKQTYMKSCIKHLEKDDKELWDKYILQ